MAESAVKNPVVAIVATVETKHNEISYLQGKLAEYGVLTRIIDISLNSGGNVWDGPRKLAAMKAIATKVGNRLVDVIDDSISVVLGMGGGTGSEIILEAMRQLPFFFPKILITTLPFDPRSVVADNSVILIPTLTDICGLNEGLRQVLNNAAAMTAGLCLNHSTSIALSDRFSIGLTMLGATSEAGDQIMTAVQGQGHETTVFHANGYGGAAFSRFVSCGMLRAVVDLTCHELTRMIFAGAHVKMPDRFSVAGHLPRIVLPGGINFLDLGEISSIAEHYLDRPYYQHSGYFTHVKLTEEEMKLAANALACHLNKASAPVHVIVPMGGFSHQDCPGGAIEDYALRGIFYDTVCAALTPDIQLIQLPYHINAPQTADCVVQTLMPYLKG